MTQAIRVLQSRILFWAVPIFLSSSIALAQDQPTAVEDLAPSNVPRMIQFNGTLKDRIGNPLTGVQGITLSLYKEQTQGSPLWMESQNVVADEQGRYVVLLGVVSKDGLPLEMFSSGQSRWLGVQPQLPGEPEQPRILLVSVPYALKAADAETLGGMPASAFALAPSPEQRVCQLHL